jgi:hypothetical protein
MKTDYIDFNSFEQDLSILSRDLYSHEKENPNLGSLLYQSGYLTIKEILEDNAILGFPNSEVRYAFFEELYKHCFDIPVGNKERPSAYQLRNDLKNDKLDEFIAKLKILFARLPYGMHQHFEGHYQSLFQIVLELLGYDYRSEVHTAKGRADAVLRINNFVYLFEFKMNENLQVAMDQIDEKGYLEPFLNSGLALRKVAVIFDFESRNIKEWKIEKECVL